MPRQFPEDVCEEQEQKQKEAQRAEEEERADKQRLQEFIDRKVSGAEETSTSQDGRMIRFLNARGSMRGDRGRD
jgi:hypothetical protein